MKLVTIESTSTMSKESVNESIELMLLQIKEQLINSLELTEKDAIRCINDAAMRMSKFTYSGSVGRSYEEKSNGPFWRE